VLADRCRPGGASETYVLLAWERAITSGDAHATPGLLDAIRARRAAIRGRRRR
jgi:hypothetical protein